MLRFFRLLDANTIYDGVDLITDHSHFQFELCSSRFPWSRVSRRDHGSQQPWGRIIAIVHSKTDHGRYNKRKIVSYTNEFEKKSQG